MVLPVAALSPDLEPFLAQCSRRRYAAKAAIIHQGDRATDLFYVEQGSVTVLLADDQGHELVLAYLNQGEFFGEIGLFSEQRGRSALVRARTACEIAQISYAKLRQLGDLYPRITTLITGQLARRLLATNRRLGDLAFMDVYGRLARTLLQLCTEPDVSVQAQGILVRVTHRELGRLVGCSREMVGKVLKEMALQKQVGLAGRAILVLGVKPATLS